MAASYCLREGGHQVPPPSQAPEYHITRKSNATTRLGLPDKPAPRHMSEQKHADEEQVKQMKEAKKLARKDAYQLLHLAWVVHAMVVRLQQGFWKVQQGGGEES